MLSQIHRKSNDEKRSSERISPPKTSHSRTNRSIHPPTIIAPYPIKYRSKNAKQNGSVDKCSDCVSKPVRAISVGQARIRRRLRCGLLCKYLHTFVRHSIGNRLCSILSKHEQSIPLLERSRQSRYPLNLYQVHDQSFAATILAIRGTIATQLTFFCTFA